jgi:hypothetical protein
LVVFFDRMRIAHVTVGFSLYPNCIMLQVAVGLDASVEIPSVILEILWGSIP